MTASLFQNPADAFRHTASAVVGEHKRAKIENRHCGDFCGDLSYILAHLATTQIIFLIKQTAAPQSSSLLPRTRDVARFQTAVQPYLLAQRGPWHRLSTLKCRQ
jgi:hypothetical protein